MNSTEYQDLISNVSIIISEFRNFPMANTSEPENQRKMRACIFMIHAEIETYFELIALKVINSYNGALTKKQKAKINHFIVFYSNLEYAGQTTDIAKRIEDCINKYKNVVINNNGIKEKDLLKLLLPIGLPLNSIDTLWLTTINSFGSLRGELTHKNINQISKIIGYRFIDETVINIILPGIKQIDLDIKSKYNI